MAEVSNHFLHSGMREKIQLIKIEKRKAKNEFSKHFIALTSTHPLWCINEVGKRLGRE